MRTYHSVSCRPWASASWLASLPAPWARPTRLPWPRHIRPWVRIPTLPAPEKKTIPVVQIAEAKGWPPGMKPTAPAGVQVNAFASGLQHPRWLYMLPNGDVLVAETAAPPRPEDGKGIKGEVMKKMQGKAGSARAFGQSHHAAARRRRRWRRRDQDRIARPDSIRRSAWR